MDAAHLAAWPQFSLVYARRIRPAWRERPKMRREHGNAPEIASSTPHPLDDARMLLLPCLQETRQYVADVMKTWDKSKTGDLQTDEVKVLSSSSSSPPSPEIPPPCLPQSVSLPPSLPFPPCSTFPSPPLPPSLLPPLLLQLKKKPSRSSPSQPSPMIDDDIPHPRTHGESTMPQHQQAWLSTVNDGKPVTDDEAQWVVYMCSSDMTQTASTKSETKASYMAIVNKAVRP